MEQLQTVSAVSKNLGISNRMLRYYEQIGLVQSRHIEGYSYRVYDDRAIQRLRQIIVLRKLRVSVRQICEILNNDAAANVIEVFERNIVELDEEITAMATIRSILRNLVNELREKANMQLQLDWINDSSVIPLADALSFPKNTIRENTMEDLNNASEKLNQLTDVRVIYLPPMTVAASQCEGEDTEGQCARNLKKFILDAELFLLKPDLRSFGFNIYIEDKMPETGQASPCWEQWVSIPDGMAAPVPLFTRRFLGGLYAAHMIKMGGWDDWGKLVEWVKASELYDFDWNSRCEPDRVYRGERYDPDKAYMDPALEEYLNYYTNIQNPDFKTNDMQLDLLLPIKARKI